MPEAPFDSIAKDYDRDFTNSLIGRMQRSRVRHFVKKTIGKQKISVLEINCGTGEDAIWFQANGHSIIATDISRTMINVAKKKTPDIDFRACGFNELAQTFEGQKFDLIFSNFGGLNCIDRNELEQMQLTFNALLNENAWLIVVFIAQKSWIEQCYFRWKGQPEKSNRRMQVDQAVLTSSVFQNTWCYAVKDLEEIFSSFRLQHHYPVGIAIPPSYLEKPFQSWKILHPFVRLLEHLFGRFSSLSDYGDHVYLAFRK